MSDYCYSFPVFNRVLSQADLMDRMLERIGISPVRVIRHDNGASWYEARTRCIDCEVEDRCRAWLAAVPTDGEAEKPSFCPNSAFFCSLGEG
jgi:hypothetical protein